MSNTTTQKPPKALLIKTATDNHKVAVMEGGTVRILGDVSALTGQEARMIAYALMSCGSMV